MTLHLRPLAAADAGRVAVALAVSYHGAMFISRGACSWLRFALLAGCSGQSLPLEDCETGLFHADCGGADADPVIGCDVASGACRWFAGGVVAAGHVASACPTDDPCCVPSGRGRWPFSGWYPGGEILERAQNDLGTLVYTVVSAESPTGVPVRFDYLGEPMFYSCTGSLIACRDGGTIEISRSGSSLVVVIRLPSRRTAFMVEVFATSGGAFEARLFTGAGRPFDVPASPVCGGAAYLPLHAEGSLRLREGSMESPASAHGLLEVRINDGTNDLGDLRFVF